MAIVFAIGGSVGVLAAAVRGRLRLLRPPPAALALGIYGLFGFHAFYFSALRLAPPAEANLIASLWALFTVLFSGLLPSHRLRTAHVIGALMGLTGATVLVWDKLGAGADAGAHAWGFVLAIGGALVWSSYSVASRLLAAVPSESIAVSCLATAGLALICSLTFEQWTAPADATSWLALAGLGLGPVGTAFLLWDVGMKKGDIPLLGVLSYATPIISTALLATLGLTEPTLSLVAACALMVAAAVVATRL